MVHAVGRPALCLWPWNWSALKHGHMSVSLAKPQCFNWSPLQFLVKIGDSSIFFCQFRCPRLGPSRAEVHWGERGDVKWPTKATDIREREILRVIFRIGSLSFGSVFSVDLYVNIGIAMRVRSEALAHPFRARGLEPHIAFNLAFFGLPVLATNAYCNVEDFAFFRRAMCPCGFMSMWVFVGWWKAPTTTPYHPFQRGGLWFTQMKGPRMGYRGTNELEVIFLLWLTGFGLPCFSCSCPDFAGIGMSISYPYSNLLFLFI